MTPEGANNSISYDAVIPESIERLAQSGYEHLFDFVNGQGITYHQAFLTHSEKKRTLYTGKAILSGAFDIKPRPTSQEEADNISFGELEIEKDARLDYEDLQINRDAAKRDGELVYLTNWMANPESNSYEGLSITPFNELVRSRRFCLANAINRLSSEKDLGILVTHCAIAEPIAISIVNSARKNPVKSFEEIGGLFDKEDFATLIIDYNQKSGLVEARFVRKDREYKVNLQNLRD